MKIRSIHRYIITVNGEQPYVRRLAAEGEEAEPRDGGVEHGLHHHAAEEHLEAEFAAQMAGAAGPAVGAGADEMYDDVDEGATFEM